MQGRDGSLSFPTLVVASLSSAAAALLTSLFWESGTVFSAAFTPVIVSIVSEGLKKPASTISQVRASRRERVAPARAGAAGADRGRGGAATVERPASSAPSPPGSPAAKRFGRRRINMRLALVTGALAFVIAAAFLTLPELLVGQSIAGQPGRTTLGGGSSVDRSGEQDAPAASGQEAGAPADPAADPEAEPAPDPAGDPEAGATRAPDAESDGAAPEPPQQQRSGAPEQGGSGAPTEPQQSQPAEPQQP